MGVSQKIENRIARKGIFITGTDTEVGKTVAMLVLGTLLKERGVDVGAGAGAAELGVCDVEGAPAARAPPRRRSSAAIVGIGRRAYVHDVVEVGTA